MLVYEDKLSGKVTDFDDEQNNPAAQLVCAE